MSARYIKKYCRHVRDKKRRIHCAMVAALDESVGNITRTLENEVHGIVSAPPCSYQFI